MPQIDQPIRLFIATDPREAARQVLTETISNLEQTIPGGARWIPAGAGRTRPDPSYPPDGRKPGWQETHGHAPVAPEKSGAQRHCYCGIHWIPACAGRSHLREGILVVTLIVETA